MLRVVSWLAIGVAATVILFKMDLGRLAALAGTLTVCGGLAAAVIAGGSAKRPTEGPHPAAPRPDAPPATSPEGPGSPPSPRPSAFTGPPADCFHCGGRLKKKTTATSEGSGCIVMILGLALTPFFVGIPIALVGLYLMVKSENHWQCRSCGALFPRKAVVEAAIWAAVCLLAGGFTSYTMFDSGADALGFIAVGITALLTCVSVHQA